MNIFQNNIGLSVIETKKQSIITQNKTHQILRICYVLENIIQVDVDRLKDKKNHIKDIASLS